MTAALIAATAGLIGGLCQSSACGQSLFRAPMPVAPPPQPGAPDAQATPNPPGSAAPASGPPAPTPPASPAPPAPQPGGAQPAGRAQPLMLRDVSLTFVQPPEPRAYRVHDKVEIIVNIQSLISAEQTLETEKEYDFNAELRRFPALRELFREARLLEGVDTAVGAEFAGQTEFEGEGEYERTDRFTTRISAMVVDVKPNGLLVLEAKESVTQDDEVRTLVISGLCSQDDLTAANTVQSSQIANLSVVVKHEGELRNATRKGLIPRIFETLFNF
ncbi:MAG: hypothetical protein C0475_06805 [Planctomyces sp.]|nr:hypothetical protein [Planctomyces sp.]MBA4039355.1 hypothetical protein [Planctomyces sp.]